MLLKRLKIEPSLRPLSRGWAWKACLILGFGLIYREPSAGVRALRKTNAGEFGSSGQHRENCRKADLKTCKGQLVEEKAQFSGASALVSIFVVLAACKLGSQSLSRSSSLFFIIAIVWPLKAASPVLLWTFIWGLPGAFLAFRSLSPH